MGMGMGMKNKSIIFFSLCYLSIICVPINVEAQQNVAGSVISGNSQAAMASTPTDIAKDNEPGTQNSRSWTIKPRVTLTETWSDNVTVSAGGNTKESGLITELAPGVRIDAKTARFKAYFDYALRGQFYTTPSGYSRSQNQLNTFGTLEAISNWLFLDFSGIIAQQSISAFGTQSPNNSSINNNLTETSTYRLSPYIRGQFAGYADYSLRYNRSTTHANTSSVSDIDLSEWAGQLRGSTPFQNLKWSVDATQQTTEYSTGRKTDADRLYATGTYTIVPQFRVSLSGGQETNNYASAERETHATHGYGFDWTPTERSSVSVFKEKRFFGDGHRINVSHRFPLSSISYTDTKDVSVLPNQFTSVGMGTVFDLWHQICSQRLAATYPNMDPIQLDSEAIKCATFFSGNSANKPVVSSFLSSSATLQRRQQLALALQGARNTLTLMVNRNENQSILTSVGASDDFGLNNINNIRQRGFSLNLSHRLSELSNINLIASRQESTGTGANSLKSTMTMYQASLTAPLGTKTNGSISVRHSEFDNTTNPYTENALIGTISVIF